MIRKYMARADKVLARAVEKDRDKNLARHLAQRRLLAAKSIEVGDYKGALAALKDEAILLNLYPPTQHRHAGPDGGPIVHDVHQQLTDDERDAIRERLADRLAARLGRGPGIPFGNGDGHRN